MGGQHAGWNKAIPIQGRGRVPLIALPCTWSKNVSAATRGGEAQGNHGDDTALLQHRPANLSDGRRWDDAAEQ